MNNLSLRIIARRLLSRTGGLRKIGGIQDVPTRLKNVTATELSSFMRQRGSDQKGADGRPQWVAENLPSIQLILLVPVSWNPPNMLRCNAVVFLSAGSVGRFPIHLTRAEYDDLPSVSRRSAATQLREVLLHFPMTPFDESQAVAWQALMEPENRD